MTHKLRRTAWFTYLISVRISRMPIFLTTIRHTDRGWSNSRTRHYRLAHATITLPSLGFLMTSISLARVPLLYSKMRQSSSCYPTLARTALWMAMKAIGTYPLSPLSSRNLDSPLPITQE